MIQLKNLERSYKTAAGQTWVLRRINLDIREGEFITIMGPSGAGKSSLLNALALLDDSWEGEYWFREDPVHQMKRKQRAELAKRNIGMVFQSYHLLDDLTVQENIDLPLSYKDIPRRERQGLVADTLDRFQIVGKKDLYPSQLSGGQQQLVGIARAVIHQPPLLLADEPTGNLHSDSGQGDHGTLSRFESAGHDDRPGHTLGNQRQLRKPHHPTARWMDGWRHSESWPQPARGGQRIVTLFAARLSRPVSILLLACGLSSTALLSQTQAPAPQPAPANASASPTALQFDMPKSRNPLNAYSPDSVPEPALSNSPRIDQLVRDGKLYLSLKDAIDLALEDNLDLAIARYNLPIANTDILRTKAGGFFRGVNTGVVQGTPGGGVGGFGTGAPGAGAGGTTGGAGGAGAGASGLVQSTLGAGTTVSSYDPFLNLTGGVEHQTSPVANRQIYGVSSLQLNSVQVNALYSQAFATGTSVNFSFGNSRQTTNSPYFNLSPSLSSTFRFQIQQELLAGFGFGPNLRYLHIARNNKKISDIAFKDQVIATVTQIENIYWDLVSAYEQTHVNEQSFSFAQQTLDNARKQLKLESVPAMDVMRAEAEVSKRDQDLTIARTSLQLQETLMKNAITKSLDDPVLEAMPVVPTDKMETVAVQSAQPIQDLISEAQHNRPDLAESDIDLVNRQISRSAARNALLPALSLVAFYAGSGLAGPLNPIYNLGQNVSNVPYRFQWRIAEHLQQLFARLLCGTESEHPDSQPRRQGGSVPVGTGVSSS